MTAIDLLNTNRYLGAGKFDWFSVHDPPRELGWLSDGMQPGFEIRLSTGLVEIGNWSTIHHEGVSLEYGRLHAFYGGTDQRSAEGIENSR